MPVVPPSLPFPIDTSRATLVSRGATHWFLYSSRGPWAINALVIDRAACLSARAVKGFPTAMGREKTSVLLARLDDTVEVIGGVNADFFMSDPPGVPTNVHVSRGRTVQTPNGRPAIAFDSSGAPHITRFESFVHLPLPDGGYNQALRPFHPMEAVGGRPVLLRRGVIVPGVDSGGAFATARHPRTAIGIGREGTRLLFVTIDGRQRPYSDGMTLRETAELMRALGSADAINLDGGGSTTMVVANAAGRPSVVNRPSDLGGERPVGNALAVVRSC